MIQQSVARTACKRPAIDCAIPVQANAVEQKSDNSSNDSLKHVADALTGAGEALWKLDGSDIEIQVSCRALQ